MSRGLRWDPAELAKRGWRDPSSLTRSDVDGTQAVLDHAKRVREAVPGPVSALLQPRQAPKRAGGVISHPLLGFCRAAGLPVPRTEFRFHPTRKWQFDYAFPDHLIAVENEGGIWRKGGGAHSHPSNIQRDIEKYNAAAILGWRILRYAPEDLSNAIPDLKVVLGKP